MIRTGIVLPLLACFLLIILSGCKDEANLKQDLEQMVANQPQIENFSFQGQADIEIEPPAPSGEANPLMAALVNTLGTSHWDWQGVVERQPLRVEATVAITPAGAKSGYHLSLMIKDSKLYFNIPLIGSADQYFSINLPTEQIDQLTDSSQLVTEISRTLINGMDSKWFKKDKQTAELADGAASEVISIEIRKEHLQEASSLLQKIVPQISDILLQHHLITDKQKEEWTKQKEAGSFQLDSPSFLSFTVDENGFIRAQHADIHFTPPSRNEAISKNNHVEWNQIYSNINQNPIFTKELPTNATPFDDVLKLF